MRGRDRVGWDSNRAHGRQTARNWELSTIQRGYREEQLQNFLTKRLRKNQDVWGYDRRVVLDIYSPLRKSKSGRRFGFVRFLDVKDEVVLERQLDQITVEASKLWVNRPRFKKEEQRSRVVKRLVEKNHIKPWRSCVEVVKGNHRMIANKMKQPQPVMDVGFDQNIERGGFPLAKRLLRGNYILNGNDTDIAREFFMEGYFSCKVRPMGGRLVLLEGSDQDEIKDLAEIVPEWLGLWFEDMSLAQNLGPYIVRLRVLVVNPFTVETRLGADGRTQMTSVMMTTWIEAVRWRLRLMWNLPTGKMMRDDGSKEQTGEDCTARSIGKNQNLLITNQGETTEDIGYVPDSMSEHLMKSQKQNSNNVQGDSSGLFSPLIPKEQDQGEPSMEGICNKSKKNRKLEELMPRFYSGDQNQIADELIVDGGIENRNRRLRFEVNKTNGDRIWSFAKEIGVVAQGNEDEVLQKLNAMEERDKE
ncbi:hypothetical protein SLEP1_g56677 [Rubroshorea leprosula]|uniref:RRM domain-containing protein n=1 Tax=Rubroshorea leprosula TaxID=152421 RepID=A0AAV5MJ14_9ROSI|nr:hypothetical protein SLEP1_g56677 [Rubroshorea leprosula]